MTEYVFFKGQRVRLTEAGLAQFRHQSPNTRVPYNRELRGTVVGLINDPQYIMIKRDGITTPTDYSRAFWEDEHDV